MVLIRENVERHTDDKKEIEMLKSEGYEEVKANDRKPKGKGSRKAPKADTE